MIRKGFSILFSSSAIRARGNKVALCSTTNIHYSCYYSAYMQFSRSALLRERNNINNNNNNSTIGKKKAIDRINSSNNNNSNNNKINNNNISEQYCEKQVKKLNTSHSLSPELSLRESTSQWYDKATKEIDVKIGFFKRRWCLFRQRCLAGKTMALCGYTLVGITGYALVCAIVHVLHRRSIDALFHPREDYMLDDWQDVEPTLQPGDIILMRGVGWLSWAIATAQLALGVLHPAALRYSHVAVVVEPAQYVLEDADDNLTEYSNNNNTCNRKSNQTFTEPTSSVHLNKLIHQKQEAEKRQQQSNYQPYYYEEQWEEEREEGESKKEHSHSNRDNMSSATERNARKTESKANYNTNNSTITTSSMNNNNKKNTTTTRSSTRRSVADLLREEASQLARKHELKRGAVILEAMDNMEFHVPDINGEQKYFAVQRVEATKRLCSKDAQGNHAYVHFSVRRLRNFKRTPEVLHKINEFCADNEDRPMDSSVLYVLSFIHPKLYEWLRPKRFELKEVSCSELIVELYQKIGLIQRHWRWVPLTPREEEQFHVSLQSECIVEANGQRTWINKNGYHHDANNINNCNNNYNLLIPLPSPEDATHGAGAMHVYENFYGRAELESLHPLASRELPQVASYSVIENAQHLVDDRLRYRSSHPLQVLVRRDEYNENYEEYYGDINNNNNNNIKTNNPFAEESAWNHFTTPNNNNNNNTSNSSSNNNKESLQFKIKQAELRKGRSYINNDDANEEEHDKDMLISNITAYPVLKHHLSDFSEQGAVLPACDTDESHGENNCTQYATYLSSSSSSSLSSPSSSSKMLDNETLATEAAKLHLYAGDMAEDKSGKLYQLRWYYRHHSLQTSPFQFTEGVDRSVLDWAPLHGLGMEIRMEIPDATHYPIDFDPPLLYNNKSSILSFMNVDEHGTKHNDLNSDDTVITNISTDEGNDNRNSTCAKAG